MTKITWMIKDSAEAHTGDETVQAARFNSRFQHFHLYLSFTNLMKWTMKHETILYLQLNLIVAAFKIFKLYIIVTICHINTGNKAVKISIHIKQWKITGKMN